jgi:hypothetical protein
MGIRITKIVEKVMSDSKLNVTTIMPYHMYRYIVTQVENH